MVKESGTVVTFEKEGECSVRRDTKEVSVM